jgi:hypothetical protein
MLAGFERRLQALPAGGEEAGLRVGPGELLAVAFLQLRLIPCGGATPTKRKGWRHRGSFPSSIPKLFAASTSSDASKNVFLVRCGVHDRSRKRCLPKCQEAVARDTCHQTTVELNRFAVGFVVCVLTERFRPACRGPVGSFVSKKAICARRNREAWFPDALMRLERWLHDSAAMTLHRWSATQELLGRHDQGLRSDLKGRLEDTQVSSAESSCTPGGDRSASSS